MNGKFIERVRHAGVRGQDDLFTNEGEQQGYLGTSTDFSGPTAKILAG